MAPTNERDVVHVVIAGGIVFAAYRHADSGELHARTVTGAKSVSVEVLDHVPDDVLADIQIEFDSDIDDETPVDAPMPKTSRAARATDPRWDTSDIDNGVIRRR